MFTGSAKILSQLLQVGDLNLYNNGMKSLSLETVFLIITQQNVCLQVLCK